MEKLEFNNYSEYVNYHFHRVKERGSEPSRNWGQFRKFIYHDSAYNNPKILNKTISLDDELKLDKIVDALQKNDAKAALLDKYYIKKYCCRSRVLTYVRLIEIIT